MALHCYRAAFSAIFVLLPAVCYGWGLCNDNDVSCANWAKAGECEKAPHIKKLCPHSCGACDHLCKDLDQSCLGWADSGECDENPDFMIKHCPVTCGQCKVKCYDTDAACSSWARDGECKKNPSLLSLCPVSCGVCTDLCLDKKADCPQWAAAGDCGSNEGYMLKECPRSCTFLRRLHGRAPQEEFAPRAGWIAHPDDSVRRRRPQAVYRVGRAAVRQQSGRDAPRLSAHLWRVHTCLRGQVLRLPELEDGWALRRRRAVHARQLPAELRRVQEMEPPPPKGKDEM